MKDYEKRRRDKLLYNLFWTSVIISLCLSIGILLTPWYSYEYASYPNKKMIEESNEKIESLSWSSKILYIPIFEELLFRGPIYISLFRRKKNAKFSLKFSYILAILLGLLFGFAHILNGGIYIFHSVIFELTMEGILLGFLVIKTRSLLYSISAHSVLNILAMI